MTTTEPRIVPSEEARTLLTMAQGFAVTTDRETLIHYAYTAVVLGEQREAVLALLATADKYQDPGVPTEALRRAVGVTE